ncbi:hypothetical protein U1Q18_051139, partial [Sarracenia purpurea var. burkii]
RLVQLPVSTFCCRNSTYQAKKLNPICSQFISKSPSISSNFTRSYKAESNPKINEFWIGSKPGDGLIRGRAASSLQDTFIVDFVINNEEGTDEDLNKLREKVFQVVEGSF